MNTFRATKWPLSITAPKTIEYKVFHEPTEIYSFYGLTLSEISSLLIQSAKYVQEFNLEKFRPCTIYPVAEPIYPNIPLKPVEPLKPIIPIFQKSERPRLESFIPKLSRKDKILIFPAIMKMGAASDQHEKALAAWKRECAEIERNDLKYKKIQEDYDEQHIIWKNQILEWEQYKEEVDNKFDSALSRWQHDKEKYESAANIDLKKFESLALNEGVNDKNAFLEFCKFVIYKSPFSKHVAKNFTLEFDSEEKILLIEFFMPNLELLQLTKENGRDANQTEQKKYKELLLYSIPIRLMYEVAALSNQNQINSIVFNGLVTFFDRATGHERTEYILSVMAKAEELKKLKIENVDPKECFKQFKGLHAGKIIEMIPIAPLIYLNKKDNRIIENKEVLSGITSEHNLAIMDWADFEHLIREIFEKEFSGEGAEVKVTQASHDRGVDAIIYDPHPLKGGKFVIQAKRYTNTVDVSAVRDLYGTVMNEGANRGILVTTSSYGADSYEFAKDKPISLVNGANLLHLFKKHGHDFKIDLKEAKQLLKRQ